MIMTSSSSSPQNVKKPRIIYGKEFLMECSFLPIAKQKPADFPLQDLGCTLATMRTRTPVTPTVYVPPKKKEELERRERDPPDNISLRPHGGNVTGGTSNVQRFYDRNRDTGYRDRNLKEPIHRDVYREYKRHPPPHRDGLMGREDGMGREGEREPEWFSGGSSPVQRYDDRNRDGGYRDRNFRQFDRNTIGPYDRKDHNHRDMQHQHREYKRHSHRDGEGDKEPEWFSGGPSSQHETIELRGFMDDERQMRGRIDVREKAKDTNVIQQDPASPHTPNSIRNRSEIDHERNCEMNLNLENILKMENIPGLNNGLSDNEPPSGSSKFSKIFQLNSASSSASVTGDNQGKFLLDKLQNPQSAPPPDNRNSNVETDGKKEIAEELGNALRNILLTPKGKTAEEPEPEKKPPPPRKLNRTEKKYQKKLLKTDINVLQAMLDNMIQSVPGGDPGPESEQPAAKTEPPANAEGNAENAQAKATETTDSVVGPPPGLNFNSDLTRDLRRAPSQPNYKR